VILASADGPIAVYPRPANDNVKGWAALMVIFIMPETPAARAGLKKGDVITSVDGKTLKTLSVDVAGKLLRGPVGSRILLSVLRKGAPLSFQLQARPDRAAHRDLRLRQGRRHSENHQLQPANGARGGQDAEKSGRG
jgi:C-terminal processing protease CtpA/Prc